MSTSPSTSTPVSDYFHKRNADPVHELEDAIVAAVWHAARRSLGLAEALDCPRCGTKAGEPEQMIAERDDPETTRRVHLEALRLAHRQGLSPTGWAVNARGTGHATWAQIGDVLGITRQAAHERFARHVAISYGDQDADA